MARVRSVIQQWCGVCVDLGRPLPNEENPAGRRVANAVLSPELSVCQEHGGTSTVRTMKGEHQDHYTTGELVRFLGISERTLKRWQRDGKLPDPAVVTEHGWKLWSPDQAREILDWRLGS